MNAVVKVVVSGARGPRGAASGPLADETVGADEIKASDAAAIRSKLDVPTASEVEAAKAGFVTPEEKGAVGDGVANDRSAYLAAESEAIGTGKRLKLSAEYNLGSSYLTLAAANFYGDGPAPKLKGAVLLNPASDADGVPIQIEYDNGTTTRRDEMAASYKRPFSEKSLWLGSGDQKAVKHAAVAPASMLLSINDFPASDAWPIGAYGAVGTTGIGFTPDTNGRWYAATVPVHGGMELAASISGDDLNRGVVVICTGGTFGFYASDFGQGSWFYKPVGGAIATGNVDWSGRTTHESWIGKNVGWTLRLYDSQTIGVLLNGTEVYRQTLSSGHIVRGGFMLMRTATGADGAVEWVTASRVSTPSGGRRVRLAIYGDSKSAPYFGDWANAFREALDGSAGVRVESIVNHAVPGNNSNDQLLAMTASPPVGASDCVIHIGTNDIQAGATSEVSVDKIGDMIDIAEANGCRVHLVVPDLWYGQSEAGSTGEVTLNYGGGARTRAAIHNLAAARGCTVVVLPQVLGPVLGSQVTAPDASDCRLRDNIHPTAFTYRLAGVEIAKVVLREAAREMRRAVPLSALPGALQNSWTAGSDAPSFSLSEDGVCRLSGFAVPGTKTDGTIVYTLPRNLWPVATARFIQWIGNANYCVVEIDAGNGQLSIRGASAALYLSLDGIAFQTKSLFA